MSERTSDMTPRDYDPMLAMMKDMKLDVSDIKRSVGDINREMGGVQQALKDIRIHGANQDKEINAIRTNQANCAARQGLPILTDRIARIEARTDREDATGRVVVPVVSDVDRLSGRVVRHGVVRYLPWIVTLLMTGAAGGGFLLSRLLLP